MNPFDTRWYHAKLSKEAVRLRAALPPSPKRDSVVIREAEIHQAILDECRRRGWLVFHGSMATATARTRGEPDFVICREGGVTLMVEVKTRIGKLSTDQQAVAAWARKLGHTVFVVRSFEEFLQLLL